jgi:hypothetical protein
VAALTVGVMVASTAIMIPKNISRWMLIASGGSDVHVNDVAKVAEDVVE